MKWVIKVLFFVDKLLHNVRFISTSRPFYVLKQLVLN